MSFDSGACLIELVGSGSWTRAKARGMMSDHFLQVRDQVVFQHSTKPTPLTVGMISSHRLRCKQDLRTISSIPLSMETLFHSVLWVEGLLELENYLSLSWAGLRFVIVHGNSSSICLHNM